MRFQNLGWAWIVVAALVAACGDGGSDGGGAGGEAGLGPTPGSGGGTATGGQGPGAGGESTASSGGSAATSVSFSQDIQPIFDARCTGCHATSGTASFLPLTSGSAYDNLVGASSTRTGTPPAGVLVVAGSSSESVLYQRVSGDGLPGGESTMPISGAGLDDAQLALIRTWIDEGAADN
jgi:hypothetical protein